MARNPYNDFPPNVRTKAGQWYRRQIASGLLVVDDNCMTCGSPQRVAGHSEDYSSPYGPHIGAFDICWFCHMMIHCRKRSAIAWDRYMGAVEDAGLWFPCNGYDFERFKAEFLANKFPMLHSETAESPRLVSLADIHHGVYNPNVTPANRYWTPEHKRKRWQEQQPPALL